MNELIRSSEETPMNSQVEVISVELEGQTFYGVMEVYPVEGGVRCRVHHALSIQETNPVWGTDAEERHNMKVRAEAMLLELATV